MHSNRSNPSQFRVSHLSRQSTVRLYDCTVWLLYGTGTVMYGYCMVLTTVWLLLYGYSCTAVQLYCMVPVLVWLLDLLYEADQGTGVYLYCLRLLYEYRSVHQTATVP